MSAGSLAKTCNFRARASSAWPLSRSASADTALRLAKALGTSPEIWLNLQNEFDVQTAKRQVMIRP